VLLWELSLKAGFIEEGFDINILTEQMFISKRQFERRIKKVKGLSPAKLVLEVRLQKAREHLEKENYSTVSEVS
jgi:transcriptional regulator GlxA family with amidase domain